MNLTGTVPTRPCPSPPARLVPLSRSPPHNTLITDPDPPRVIAFPCGGRGRVSAVTLPPPPSCVAVVETLAAASFGTRLGAQLVSACRGGATNVRGAEHASGAPSHWSPEITTQLPGGRHNGSRHLRHRCRRPGPRNTKQWTASTACAPARHGGQCGRRQSDRGDRR